MTWKRDLTVLGILVATLAMGEGLVASTALTTRARSSRTVPQGGNLMQDIPLAAGEWQGSDVPVREEVFEILETRNILQRRYVNHEDEIVFLDIVQSETDGRATHPPEVCYIGEGVEIVKKDRLNLNIGGSALIVNRLVVQDGGRQDLVLYWYKAGDLKTASYWGQQCGLLLRRLKGMGAQAALVRFSTHLGANSLESSQERIAGLAEALKYNLGI
ncbi:MAG: EpsI family protein [Candidatus Omnitrophica bacterium]|nr:EpsI family protein [Candidatus Omnitrophota bacterium]